MKIIRQAQLRIPWLLFLAALLGCGQGTPEGSCEPAPPADPSAYIAITQAQRQAREAGFRTSRESPVPAADRPAWSGLEYYPVDPELVFEGPLVRRLKPRVFTIISTSGEQRPIQEVGYFRLDLGVGLEKLPVYRLLDQPRGSEDHLFVPFMDATTEIETYPAGRYLDVEERGSDRYRIDFNQAYNPSCAYGGDYSCPVTPEPNRLKAAVRAGERGYKYLHE